MNDFSKKIIDWYRAHRRELPWRETSDPYKIWLSEIILQQTRVAQGTPYYLGFIETYPTVRDLARAPEDAVLRLWQGLGYYSRARNLHRCAKTIVDQYDGKFPTTYQQLVTLPGIGPYTAAAIASIGFNENVAVVDGNVFRVLARIFGVDTDIASPAGKKEFTEIANRLIDPKQPGDHNQAVMEFGAMHCTPTAPQCDNCPFNKACVARQRGTVDLLPVKGKRLTKRTRYFDYVVWKKGNEVAMRPRTGRDIWTGLYEFHLLESDRRISVSKLKKDPSLKRFGDVELELVESVKHVLTHQLLHIRFFQVKASKKSASVLENSELGLAFYLPNKADKLPKPIVITRFLERHHS